MDAGDRHSATRSRAAVEALLPLGASGGPPSAGGHVRPPDRACPPGTDRAAQIEAKATNAARIAAAFQQARVARVDARKRRWTPLVSRRHLLGVR